MPSELDDEAYNSKKLHHNVHRFKGSKNYKTSSVCFSNIYFFIFNFSYTVGKTSIYVIIKTSISLTHNNKNVKTHIRQ